MAFQLSIYTDGKFSPTQATEDSFLRAFLERKEYGPGAADHLRQHAGDRRGHRPVYLSGEDPRFYKRGICQYPARLSGGFQSPTEINASATQCSTGALLRMLRHGGSQPYREEGASHHARRGKNAEAFLKYKIRRSAVCII